MSFPTSSARFGRIELCELAAQILRDRADSKIDISFAPGPSGSTIAGMGCSACSGQFGMGGRSETQAPQQLNDRQ